LNKPKLPLRSALEALASSLADAVIAAARDAIFEHSRSQPIFAPLEPAQTVAAEPRRGRGRPRRVAPVAVASVAPAHVAKDAATPAARVAKEALPTTAAVVPSRASNGAKRAKAVRTRAAAEPAAPGTPSDQLITDPQALLAALDTASPATAWEVREAPVRRAAPAILAPVTPPTPITPAPEVARFQDFAPALREGEVILRHSAAGVVLRRRRA
jgi:hypothetical protein